MAVVQLSEAVKSAVQRERETVASRLEALRAQAERLHRLVEELDRDVQDTSRLLRQMDEMLGLAPQLSIEAMDGEVRGRRLREIAVEILREKRGLGAEVHYREWFQLLEDAGVRVAGRDPIATFLTQIARAPGVVSVRPRSGLYRLTAT
jgi:hypothetical protein